jgi:diphosphomevalonate decarboxylase
VRAIADLYELPASPSDLSVIARQGSGSACRSLFGGYVAWNAGTEASGADSRAEQVAPAAHWQQMRALVLVVSAARKAVPSTQGMQETVATSELFAARATIVVPRRMEAMRAAVLERDFDAFANLTMRDSNSFHATCLDTDPPIFYLNDVSRAAIRAVEAINEHAGKMVAAYTFDAGPNAVVYYLGEHEASVAGVFKGILPHAEGWDGSRGRDIKSETADFVDKSVLEVLRTGVNKVLLTCVGEGPQKVDRHLIDENGNVLDG